jgi:colanic acid/amylovoran biosynthesis glycosyltransferase
LKIAYILPAFPEITETFIIREIKTLLDSGFEVKIFAVSHPLYPKIERSLVDATMLGLCTYARPDNLVNHFINNIYTFVTSPFRYLRTLKTFLKQWYDVPPHKFVRSLYHFFCGIGFVRKLQKEGITHLHCHFSAASNIGLAINLFSGLPFSWTAHASEDIFTKPILLMEKLQHASFIVAVCDYSKKYLNMLSDFKYSPKIMRIYNSLQSSEAERFVVEKPREDADRPGDRIICIATLTRCKGHGTLLEACEILAARGYNMHCEIVGDGDLREVLERMVKEKGIGRMVSLRGYLPTRKVYEMLAGADIFVLLAEIDINGYRDGFPTVILEAMLMGLPVVSTWISGIPEMVVHGETGLLVHEHDAGGAADAIARLIDDAALRKRFGSAGKKRVLEKFITEKNSHLMVDLFLSSVKEIKSVE